MNTQLNTHKSQWNDNCLSAGDIYASSDGERVSFRKTVYFSKTFYPRRTALDTCFLRCFASFCFFVLPRFLEQLLLKSTKSLLIWRQRRRIWTESWKVIWPWIQGHSVAQSSLLTDSAYIMYHPIEFVDCICMSQLHKTEWSMLVKFGGRLDITTIFKVRKWERFQFMIDYEAQQVWIKNME